MPPATPGYPDPSTSADVEASDITIGMYFAKLNIAIPKITQPFRVDEIRFAATSQVVDVLPGLCTRGMTDFKHPIELSMTEYNMRANRKLYKALVSAVAPSPDGGGCPTMMGKLRLGCPRRDGLTAWQKITEQLELDEAGPATYQAEMNALRFNLK